jgi:hypothetical protein
MKRILLPTTIAVLAGWVTAVRAADAVNAIQRPFVIAPECTAEQRQSALALSNLEQSPLACFAFEKWSFKGAALAFAQPSTSVEAFYQARRAVFRDQTARMRVERDLREAMPGSPPAHSTIPLSLFVSKRTPLGVFVNTSEYIGFADLVPVQSQGAYPVLQLDVLVLRKEGLVRLVLLSQISGTTTIAEGYRISEDWALILLGRERSPSQQ